MKTPLRSKPIFLFASAGSSAAAIAIFIVVGLVGQRQTKPSDAATYSGITITSPKLTSNLSLGATHTQYSLDGFGNGMAVSNGKALLGSSTVMQAQSIMGWGVNNPEPSAGVYDFSTLDARINGVMSGAGIKTITLCGAPDWMKGGAAGSTDWSKLEVAPTPDHYDDFAALAATVAARYPSVTYFQVWNEMKGFYNASLNRWDYEGYTSLYNKVYARIKAVRPDAKIGGPYVVMDSWSGSQSNPSQISGPWGKLDQRSLDVVTYWLAHKTGADFIAIDGGVVNHDSNTVSDFVAGAKFSAISNWVRSQTSLPMWWAEWYPFSGPSNTSTAQKNAVMAANLITTIEGGARMAALWQPQGDSSGNAYPLGIFTDTRNSGGGQATAFYTTAKLIRDNFPTGTQLYNTSNSNSSIRILASNSKMLLVNTSASTQTITTYNTSHTLPGYSITLANVDAPIVSPPPGPNPSPTPSPTGSTNPSPGKTPALNTKQVDATGGNSSSGSSNGPISLANISNSLLAPFRQDIIQRNYGPILISSSILFIVSILSGISGWYIYSKKSKSSHHQSNNPNPDQPLTTEEELPDHKPTP